MQRVRMEGLMDALTTITSHDTRAILPTISAPTLVVVGADDDETPPTYAQAIADLVPGARLVVIPGAGHLLNLEAPEALNAAIADHWEQS
jgi:pimeloyl-ACP methyl ester carboxylesterase